VLRIRQENAGFRLICEPRFDSRQLEEMTDLMTGRLLRPTGYVPQAMYGFCSDAEELTGVLSRLACSPEQIENIKRGVLQGVEQEVGGSHSGVIRLFQRRDLERVGLTFRPPDL
jgi:hypothetical protein